MKKVVAATTTTTDLPGRRTRSRRAPAFLRRPSTGPPVRTSSEKYGVFVAPGAPQDADGSRAKPFGSIAAGLEKAVASSKRLYVCTGVFKEAVKVARGISMVGGLDCSRPIWAPSGTRTRIESPTSPAIVAEDIDAPTRIEAFEILAPDGTEAAPTSIGLRARAATAVVFVGSRIAAGRGKDGAAGADGIQLTVGPSATGGASLAQVSGPSSTFLTMTYRAGAAGGIGACVGAAGFAGGNGGAGGHGGSYDSKYEAPQFGLPGYYWVDYCRPTGVSSPPCLTDWNPKPGQVLPATPGNPGADGASATTPGTLNADGYTPANGTSGTNGTPGGGGSGGAGGNMGSSYAGATHQLGQGATGPGGGAGGCPGLAGTEGRGGGASIGALVVASKGLTFDATEIASAAGGAGGKGSFGSSATLGGPAGTRLGAATAAAAGGAGGRSGVSGSGSGGPSYGIASTGGDPTLRNGAAALAGPGGAPVPEQTTTDAVGHAKTIPASVAGDSKAEHTF
jgi:hypothetical protein